jgi:cytochrome o ubiquinol oxidase subunit 1
MLFTIIFRAYDDDIHYVLPAAEVERSENEHYRQLSAAGAIHAADQPGM